MLLLDQVHKFLVLFILVDDSRIGANAVVIRDVPDNMTYVGVPARKLESSINKDSFEAYGISKGKD